MLESLVIAAPFVLLAILLPPRFCKQHCVALGSIVVIISSIWMLYANYHLVDFSAQGLAQLLPVLVLYLISIALPIALILRFKRIERIVQAIIQRVAVLVLVYVALACVGAMIVLIRNL